MLNYKKDNYDVQNINADDLEKIRGGLQIMVEVISALVTVAMGVASIMRIFSHDGK